MRSALARRDVRALSRAARSADTAELAKAWPKLTAAGRAAAFRALDARAARELFAVLTQDARWLAYLGALSDGAAPLLEGASAAQRKALRRPAKGEIAAMRRALAGSGK